MCTQAITLPTIEQLRQRYRDLAASCDLTIREMNRRCRGIFCVNASLGQRRPKDWVAAAQIVAKSVIFKDWPWEWPCCGDVRLLDCVCRFAYHCPEHGTHHVGSHE